MSDRSATGFPLCEQQVKDLVTQHLELKDQPLLLAIYYQPRREEGDIFLFEVIDGFGNGHLDPDRQFMEVTVQPTADFPMKPQQRLHLVLTSPQELETAVTQKWDHARELKEAVRARRFKVLHSSRRKRARELKELLHAA